MTKMSRIKSASAAAPGKRTKSPPEVLDLSQKKLKEFPAKALSMPGLRRLILDGNDKLYVVPAEIASLTQLEELSLTNCSLRELPESIGELSQLRILRVARNCRFLQVSAGRFVCTPVKLPRSLRNLSRLEELDISWLSLEEPTQRDAPLPDCTPYELPQEVADLPALSRLHANHTRVIFPASMYGHTGLKELSMSGGSWIFLKEFPEAVATFSGLQKLDLSCNYFTSIPSLSRLVALEELDLGNAMGRMQALPDFSVLPRLRMLKLSGFCDRTNVRVPSQDVLAPLLKMNLPSLERLAIDRWGFEAGVRPALPPELLVGIGRFAALRAIDLSFNSLTSLPDDFYTLRNLEEINLEYNALPTAVRERISATFPSAQINFDHQKV